MHGTEAGPVSSGQRDSTNEECPWTKAAELTLLDCFETLVGVQSASDAELVDCCSKGY